VKKLLPVVMALGCIAGCAYMDSFFGVKANPDGTVETKKDSPAHQIGEAVKDGGSGTPVGLIGSGMLLLANLYQAVRGRQIAKALAVTVQGIEEFTTSDAGKAVAGTLKSTLSSAHSHENVGPLMSKVVKAVTGG
jgi:hypothetical protein